MDAPQAGSDRDESSHSSSPVSVISGFWKEFDLEKEKGVLDEQGLRIADNQESSQKNRRKLAESTRDFKKASAEEKLSLFNSLLKGYQEEVDNLTKRAKFGENAFLNIYQKLYEAPDPYPALASIAEQDLKISELESENRKMKVELEEFRTEAMHLKNQQATIRRLEERNRQLEQQMEEKVKEIVEMKQHSLAEENQKTLEVLKDREQSLQDQLRQTQESVANMQKLHELAQSQLFELRAQSEEDRAAKQSEVNLLMDEVERAQTRLFSLEREKGLLRSQLQSANEESESKRSFSPLNLSSFSGYSNTADSNTILENSLSSKEKIIYELNMELHNIEITLSNEREKHVNEIKKLNSLLYEKVQNSCCYLIHQSMQYAITYHASHWKLGDYALEVVLEKMKKELQVRPTEKLVDDLRRKVKILQVVGYNSIEAEDWEAATSGEEMSKMESLLLDKNKKMEHELTQLKVKISEKVSLLETAEGKIRELEEKVKEQQKLIQKLEDDILKGYNSKERKGTLFDDWDVSESAGNKLSESSMLKVICNQRDRFRARLQETEEEIRQLKEKIGSVTSELEKTKTDNVKLYGKIRYVLDYNQEKVISRGLKKYAEDLESGFTSDVDSKYKKIYEEAINPFAAFSKKERDQRYKELGFRDRITLSSGRYVLGNKYARTFVFFYTIGLHILVFTCLYRMSSLSYLRSSFALLFFSNLDRLPSLTRKMYFAKCSNGSEEALIGDKNLDLPHGL
ncbi:hypothetical protein GQ457_17G027410 [Hibiscus cannabinus]